MGFERRFVPRQDLGHVARGLGNSKGATSAVPTYLD